MSRKRLTAKIAAFALASAAGLGLTLDVEAPPPAASAPFAVPGIGVSEAEAGPARRSVRRTARRTSRRTAARMNYYNTLPAGCPLRGAYYYCGGVYYSPVVQDGATVYIIVTP